MRLAMMIGVMAVLSGCGSPAAPSAAPAATPVAASSADACSTAFAAAAGVDAMADSVSDLYPAVRACSTLEAWTSAFDANGGAGFTGSAAEVLTNVCTAAEVADTPLCGLMP